MSAANIINSLLEEDDEIDWSYAVNFDFDAQDILMLHQLKMAVQLGYLVPDEHGLINYAGSILIGGNGLKSMPYKFGEIGGDFRCSYSPMKSLKGGPTKVGGDFAVNNMQLTSLVGAPKYVGSNFICYNNGTKFSHDDVKQVCRVNGLIMSE